MSFVDQNGISCFVDQNGIRTFVDQNGILLTCSQVIPPPPPPPVLGGGGGHHRGWRTPSILFEKRPLSPGMEKIIAVELREELKTIERGEGTSDDLEQLIEAIDAAIRLTKGRPIGKVFVQLRAGATNARRKAERVLH